MFNITAMAIGFLVLLNPCSFALLPSYIGLFLNYNQSDEHKNIFISLNKAQTFSFSMIAGLLTVFIPIGLFFSGLSSILGNLLYALDIVLGLIMLVLSYRLYKNKSIKLNIYSFNTEQSENISGVYIYGISYALASLSCSLPIITIALSNPIEPDIKNQIGTIISFSLGLIAALTTLTISIAIGQKTLTDYFKSISKKMNTISWILLLFAGLYLIWYGIWAYDPIDRPKGPIIIQERIDSAMRGWLESPIGNNLTNASLLAIGFLVINLSIAIISKLLVKKKRINK